MTEHQAEELLWMLWLILCLGSVAIFVVLCLIMNLAWGDLRSRRVSGQVPRKAAPNMNADPGYARPPSPSGPPRCAGYQPRSNVPPGAVPSKPPRNP
jgi:hypothetical protein